MNFHKKHRFHFVLLLFILQSFTLNAKNNKTRALDAIPQSIGLDNLDTQGLFILNTQPLKPNEKGIIAEIVLQLPKFQKGVYYRPFSDKVASGNRVEPIWFEQLAELSHVVVKKPREDKNMSLGTFLMVRKVSGKYLVILPVVSNLIGNTFSMRNNSVYLSVATYGTRTEHTAVPLFAYAESDNPYEAARMVWEMAMNAEGVKGNIDWRSNKTYPEPFKYLGWCSWEHYKTNINQEIILKSIADIKSSDLPFRWLMVDDGYLDENKGKLLSFGVDKKKFPNGWEPITSKKDDKIKWMGIWRNFNGYMQGVSPEHTMENLKTHIVGVKFNGSEKFMPRISPESSNAFYHEMTSITKQAGFDFVKVDFQSDNFRYNTGSENAVLGVHYNNTALEENCIKQQLPLLNCIAMQNFNVFNKPYSALIRGSVDYKTTTDRLDVTIVQNFANAFWLGHTQWLDQDMFYANQKASARLMAISRAVSGGPVYLSDEPKNIDNTVLKPLTFADGHILGTLAPGVPLPESLMQDPYYEHKAFRVIAPLINESAMIMAVNLNQDEKSVQSFISQKDYTYAGGLIQPYTGLWAIPKEGILLYNQYKMEASVLTNDYTFELDSRQEALFQLSPIKNGWSLIGRPDKYLPASGVQLLTVDHKKISIKMVEDGPVMLWSESKTPSSENFIFTKMNHGLWRGEPTKTTIDKIYTIVSL